MKARLYRTQYETFTGENGYTLVTASNKKEALVKATNIGVNGVIGMKFTEATFQRWIDVQNQFIWKSDTSKLMNNGIKV